MLEVDGRKAEQLVQVIHTGHGTELLIARAVVVRKVYQVPLTTVGPGLFRGRLSDPRRSVPSVAGTAGAVTEGRRLCTGRAMY
ncbi:hypothetical protein GCM10010518_07400 [Kitasatospora cinereorecta]